MYPVGCQFKTEKIYRLSSESAGLELSSVLENCPAFGTLWTGPDRIGSDLGEEKGPPKSPRSRGWFLLAGMYGCRRWARDTGREGAGRRDRNY